MESKGIIRRIDELGRIVIPREYRKANGIDLGDPVEICAYDSGVIKIKKVNRGDGLIKTSSAILKILCDSYSISAILTDGKNYIDGFGKRKGDFVSKEVDGIVSNLLQSRSSAVLSSDKAEFVLDGEKAIVRPIIKNGDLCGGVVVIADDSVCEVETLVEFCTNVLSHLAQSY